MYHISIANKKTRINSQILQYKVTTMTYNNLIFTTLLMFLLVLKSNAQETKSYFQEKIVLAVNSPLLHYSSTMAYLRKMRYENLMGNEESNHKGRYRTYMPLVSNMVNPMTLEDAVAYEMLTAKKMGIDGFKFPIFISANENYVDKCIKIITAYVKTAEERNIDFKFALQVDFKRNQNNFTELKTYQKTIQYLNSLYKETTYSPKWLRNSSDQIVLFTKTTFHIIDKSIRTKSLESFLNNPSTLIDIKEVFDKIKIEVGTDFSVVYEARFGADINYNNKILDYFPAIIQNQYSTNHSEYSNNINSASSSRNRPLFQVACPERIGSQLFLKENDKKIKEKHKNIDQITAKDVYIKGQNTKLTTTFRKSLESAIRNDVDLIDIYSWNSYDEGTHIAPEVHHRYGYSLLLRYYKHVWKNTEAFPFEKEVVITSYKAYHSKFLNSTNIEMNYKNSTYEEGSEDSIEIISILKEPAEIYCNGDFIGNAKVGLNTFNAPLQLGKVTITAERRNRKFINYQTKKEIVDFPERTDLLTYTFSNLDEEMDKYCLRITNNFEMIQMYNRFIISSSTRRLWKEALNEKYFDLSEALLKNGHKPEKYLPYKENVEKYYRNKVKKFIDEFQYDVWLEMEENAKTNPGIVNFNEPTKEVFNDYNILQVEDLK